MPVIEYFNGNGDRSLFEVSQDTFNNWVNTPEDFMLDSTIRLRDWIYEHGSLYEMAQADIVYRNENIGLTPMEDAKMEFTPLERTILNMVNYFKELTEAEIASKVLLLKKANNLVDIVNAIEKLYRNGQLGRTGSGKQATRKYIPYIDYGQY